MGIERQSLVSLQVSDEIRELFVKSKRLSSNSILLVLAMNSAYKGDGSVICVRIFWLIFLPFSSLCD